MDRVQITNVALLVFKSGQELFRQSIDTKSGDSLVLPNSGDTMSLSQGGRMVEGKVQSMRFEYNYGGQESLTQAIKIYLD